ncbi:LytTR family DNA-binding domain-containing protein [Yoonia sp. 2307UL14-13]|uniref:LytTR family DNA-binding domain-containing protein n=1 Tax=Yoonia sp. 2307UL14-13 TaxID=3126506 RepID=UPI003097267C
MRRFFSKAIVYLGPEPVWTLLLGLGAIMAFIGPFGSFDALSLPVRILYWVPVILGANIFVRLSSWIIAVFAVRTGSARWYVLNTLTFAGLFAPVVWAYSALFSPDLRNAAGFLFFAGNVFGLSVILSALVYAMTRDVEEHVPRPRLYDRLPDDVTGSVMRLTVDDHYVEVFLDDGTRHRLLMRLSDAIAEMDGLPGFCTHRSHWVATAHVSRAAREKNKDYLMLADGAKVPVSRTYRDDVVAAGFL